jgi:hypothetical protein
MPIDEGAPETEIMHPAIKKAHQKVLTLVILLAERTLMYSVSGKAQIARVD